MNKYFVFRKMLDFVADHAEVTDADMNFIGHYMKVTGEDDDTVIEIEVKISNKEVGKDA